MPATICFFAPIDAWFDGADVFWERPGPHATISAMERDSSRVALAGRIFRLLHWSSANGRWIARLVVGRYRLLASVPSVAASVLSRPGSVKPSLTVDKPRARVA